MVIFWTISSDEFVFQPVYILIYLVKLLILEIRDIVQGYFYAIVLHLKGLFAEFMWVGASLA